MKKKDYRRKNQVALNKEPRTKMPRSKERLQRTNPCRAKKKYKNKDPKGL